MRRHVVVLAVGILNAAGAAGQRPKETQIQPVDSLREPYSHIRGVRELSDGRLLVSDQTEVAVYLADFAKQTRTKLGGVGAGPEEYRTPLELFAMAADSTALLDIGNGRLAIFAPDGHIADTRPIADKPGFSFPAAADLKGNIDWDLVTQVRLERRTHPELDHAEIIRFSRAGKIDTVGFAKMAPGVNPGAFPFYDYWGVSGDGWIAIARNVEKYRLDWVKPDGTLQKGPDAPFEAVRVSDADKAAWGTPGSGTGGGQVNMEGRAKGPPPGVNFPDHFPAVKYHGIWITSDHHAIVVRYDHLAETRQLLDVFDDRGVLVGKLRLPEHRQLIGIGARGLYAMRIDDDGLQWIERYDLATRLNDARRP